MDRAVKDLEKVALERGLSNGGEYGTLRISDTDLHEGHFVEILAIEDAVFETLEGNIDLGAPPLTISATTKLVGRVTKIKLVSGSVYVLRGE